MRPVDQIIRDTIGNQALEIIRLTAEVERLTEAHAALTQDREKAQSQSISPEPPQP